MFFFVFSCASDEDIVTKCNRTFSIGGYNTEDNIFLSKKLPGLHFNFEGTQKELESIFECGSILSNDEFVDKITNESVFSRKTKTFTKDNVEEWKSIDQNKGFVYFRIDGIRKRVKIFPELPKRQEFQQKNGISDNIPCIYTKYNIIMNEEENNCNKFTFSIEGTEISAIKEGETLEFSFNVERAQIKHKREKVAIKHVEYIVYGIIILVLNIVVDTVICVIHKKDKNADFQYNNAWKTSKEFKNVVKITRIGSAMALYTFIMAISKSDTHFYDDFALQSIILSTFFPTVIMNIIGTAFSVDFSYYDNLFAFFVLFLAVLLPYQIINFVNRVSTGAWRGYGILTAIISNAIVIATDLMTTNGAMCTSKLLKPPFSIDTPKEKVIPSKEKYGFVRIIFDVLYSLILLAISHPFANNLIHGLVFDAPFENGIIIGGLIIMFGACGLFGIATSLYNIKKEECSSWLHGKYMRSIESFIAVFVATVFFHINEVSLLVPRIYLIFYSFVVSLFISSFGLLSSFLSSLSMMVSSFNQQKTS